MRRLFESSCICGSFIEPQRSNAVKGASGEVARTDGAFVNLHSQASRPVWVVQVPAMLDRA